MATSMKLRWVRVKGPTIDEVRCRSFESDTSLRFYLEVISSERTLVKEVPETCIKKLYPDVEWRPYHDESWRGQ